MSGENFEKFKKGKFSFLDSLEQGRGGKTLAENIKTKPFEVQKVLKIKIK